MKIIISPAKKMTSDFEDCHPLSEPLYLDKTKKLLAYLKTLDFTALKQLLKCNDKITALNLERFAKMDLDGLGTPAILSYEGIQYQYMAPKVFEEAYDAYVTSHLRILSGFYGILKPFDRIVPYRLEMQTKLETDFCKNLYDFWQDDLYQEVGGGIILNLASKEYSQAIKKYLQPTDLWIEVVFAEKMGDQIKEKGVYVKMARGEMVRYLALNQVNDIEEIKAFRGLGYQFDAQRSHENLYVFVREEK